MSPTAQTTVPAGMAGDAGTLTRVRGLNSFEIMALLVRNSGPRGRNFSPRSRASNSGLCPQEVVISMVDTRLTPVSRRMSDIENCDF